jgi:molybdate transport system ATP-binding protein
MSLFVDVNWQRGDFTLRCREHFSADNVTAFFGRSGCGKTSLLRIIAGLEKVGGAEVVFRDQVWQRGKQFLPPEKRRVGLVFQEHSLLPHLSVKANLLYGWQRTPQAERHVQIADVIGMLDIEELLGRSIDQLSGGQRQRVALGRALMASPQLLLLDEPLAALDTQTKREIFPFLSRLAQQVGVPMILVTHAPDEVQRLADHVAFMGHGLVDELCTLQQAMAKIDSPLFHDEGPSSVLEGELGVADEHGLCVFGSEGARLQVQASGVVSVGRTRLRVLARDVSVALDDPVRISIRNHLKVNIVSIHALPENRLLITTRLQDGQALLIEITAWSAEQLELRPGLEVYALIKSVALLR